MEGNRSSTLEYQSSTDTLINYFTSPRLYFYMRLLKHRGILGEARNTGRRKKYREFRGILLESKALSQLRRHLGVVSGRYYN